MNSEIMKSKKVIAFDLDGTLSKSKSALDAEMASLLKSLLNQKQVAIISGARMEQFKKQVIAFLPHDTNFKNLHFFPTNGGSYFNFNNDWNQVYVDMISEDDKKKIMQALDEVINYSGFRPTEVWGEIIEDRGSQITFSALGQNAPVENKIEWDPTGAKRHEIISKLKNLLPEFEIHEGGMTSIDINPLGLNKAYAIKKICEYLEVNVSDIVFIGDGLFPEGNDYPVIATGVSVLSIKDFDETKQLIRTIIS